MKNTILISLLMIFASLQMQAQERSGILEQNEQSVGLATGLDYSVFPLIISYNRGFKVLNYQYPVNAGLEITVPLFGLDLNDIRIRLKTETAILRLNNFEVRGGIDPVFSAVKMKTESMSSLGADFHLFVGLTNAKWNLGAEVNYNQMMTTHIKHTDVYRDNVFENAVDSWYKSTANNIKMGVLVNRRINAIDLNFRGGIARTGGFQEYLFVPGIYMSLGVNYRF